jgi:hypothetical protein
MLHCVVSYKLNYVSEIVLMMGAVGTSETLANLCKTTLRNISGDSYLNFCDVLTDHVR